MTGEHDHIPDAHCCHHQTPLTIERNHCAANSERWLARCEMCTDMDDADSVTETTGYGATPRGAVEDLEERMGVPEGTLLYRGERHV